MTAKKKTTKKAAKKNTKRKAPAPRDRGPALPVLYVDDDQRDAIHKAFPGNYSGHARALLLVLAGKPKLVDEPFRTWAIDHVIEAAEALA